MLVTVRCQSAGEVNIMCTCRSRRLFDVLHTRGKHKFLLAL